MKKVLSHLGTLVYGHLFWDKYTGKKILEKVTKWRTFQFKDGRIMHFHDRRGMKQVLDEYGFTEILKDVSHNTRELDIEKLQKTLTARDPGLYIHPDSHAICGKIKVGDLGPEGLPNILLCPGWMVHDMYETAISEMHFYEIMLTFVHNHVCLQSGSDSPIYGVCPEHPPRFHLPWNTLS